MDLNGCLSQCLWGIRKTDWDDVQRKDSVGFGTKGSGDSIGIGVNFKLFLFETT
jgi:hypothetical protein